MAPSVVASTTALDQEKFLAAKLLQLSHLKLFAASVADKVEQPQGTGTTAYFVRYKRMNVPLVTLTEGVAPSASSISVEQVTSTLDQWGDLITISDVSVLTTKHPLLQQAMKLLADNAQRVIDREIQVIMLAGTNVQYGGTATARSGLTASDTITDTVLHKARVTMVNNGAPPRDGPSNMSEFATAKPATGTLLNGQAYLAVCGPELMAEVMRMATSSGLWSSVHQYNDKMAIYLGEVGTYLGFRFVETNFIPQFRLLGNSTAAVTSGGSGGITGLVVTAVDGGGTLNSATTFFWKIVRKDLTRGFAETISIAHSTASAATGNNESFTFALPSTAGFVYDVYFDTVATGGTGTDATLGLVSANNAAGTTVTVTANPAATTNPPVATTIAGGTSASGIHPLYIIAQQALAWVGLQNLRTYVTGEGAEKSDPLGQFRTVGYKFMAKSVILDQTRLLRIELPSALS